MKKTAKKSAKRSLTMPKVVVRDLKPSDKDLKGITGGNAYRGTSYQS